MFKLLQISDVEIFECQPNVDNSDGIVESFVGF